ncbi:hypothetical protein P7C70_g4494, partial [Phenoliferia sp. Uapishka_3]
MVDPELLAPVLSLKGMHDPTLRQALAESIDKAARRYGFFQIVRFSLSFAVSGSLTPSGFEDRSRHLCWSVSLSLSLSPRPLAAAKSMAAHSYPHPAELISRAFAITRLVFDLSKEEKEALARDPESNRGYTTMGGQVLDGAIATREDVKGVEVPNEEVGKADMKEGYMIGAEISSTHEYFARFSHGPNRYPTESQVPGMRETMTEYFESLLALSKELMKVIALSLSLPSDTFDELSREPAAAIRLLHYPPAVAEIGAGAHTDFGLLTLLATSGAPGLEVFDGKTWIPLEPAEGTFVVNVGDLLALYTGGEYKSSLHRVNNTSGVDRYSIPFFLDGNSDVLVSPVKGMGEGWGKLKAVTVEEHLRERCGFASHRSWVFYSLIMYLIPRFDGTYTSDSAPGAMKAAVV